VSVEVAGKRAVVVGLGKSGVSAALLLVSRGASVVANDKAPRERLSPEALALEPAGVELAVGGHDGVDWPTRDLVVVSPGVPAFEGLARAEAAGVPVVGELELASWYLGGADVVAITGSNGKSTTTMLAFEVLRRARPRVWVGGNLGTPLADAALTQATAPFDAFVVEVSSFQAERIPTLRARAAALLNLSPNHLDRYPSYEAYCAAKGNLFVPQREGDVAVGPAGDRAVLRELARGAGRVVTFGRGGDVEVTADAIVDHVRGERYERALLRLSGEHNAANAAAAIALVAPLGASPAHVREALASFEGLPHRNVLVTTARGVRYYDDSKSTSVGASVAALEGLAEQRVVLIAGGRDKQGSYAPLALALRRKGRALVLLGEAAPLIEAAARGAVPIVRASTMEEAVALARSLAEPGDAVLLSPACSSFDMFRDYHHRGQAFVAAVRALEAEGS
jgi:UDP-N-acetylmuramoylalanine--D-glutamate ligase